MKQVTLCLLMKDNQVLLAMKKRGFGQGLWNGVGGKLNEGETVEEAVIRETKEEIGVIPTILERVATIDFLFSDKPEWDQQMCVFKATNWEGEPQESEEMKPQWFQIDKIPLDQMWEADTHWLPKVLEGVKLKANFVYTSDQKLHKSELLEI